MTAQNPRDGAPDYDAVILDIGETILDRTTEYASWADFFGVPAHTFSAVFGAMIARGAKASQVVESFAPGVGYPELLRRRTAAGFDSDIAERDLYPDARGAIAALTTAGIAVGIAGNQPERTSEALSTLGLGAAFVASSTGWGVAKPDPEFFRRAAREAGATPQRTVYVGDQLHNDVEAPRAAGLAAVRILRGPWGLIERDDATEAGCVAVVTNLVELASIVAPAPPSETRSGTMTR